MEILTAENYAMLHISRHCKYW